MSAQFVWLASYPKSGNTWMRMMLTSLQAGGAEPDINGPEKVASVGVRYEFDRIAGMESTELTAEEIAIVQPAMHRAIAREAAGPLEFRKVHDMYWATEAGGPLFPADVSLGVVYIVRDPRDVAVSYAAHQGGKPMDEVIRGMRTKRSVIAIGAASPSLQLPQRMSSWTRHAQSWLDQTAMPVLLVRYEDMLEDAGRELRRVADFVGLPTDVVDAAVACTRFDRLRAQEDEKGFLERPEKAEKFFRGGVAGEGLRTMSAEQIAAIEAEHGEMMGRLGYL